MNELYRNVLCNALEATLGRFNSGPARTRNQLEAVFSEVGNHAFLDHKSELLACVLRDTGRAAKRVVTHKIALNYDIIFGSGGKDLNTAHTDEGQNYSEIADQRGSMWKGF